MIIILEGPDGAGKTTLADQLCTRYDLRYHHEGPPPSGIDALEYYGHILEGERELIAGGAKGIVFDRLALGERVYGPIYREHDRLGENGWRVFQRLINAANAVQVMCLPPYQTCYESWSSGRNEMIARSKVDVFHRTYNRFDDLASPSQIRYDWTTDELTWLCGEIEAEDKSRHALPPGMNGAPNGRYLFVGEKGANPESLTTDLAFFGVTNSSWWLTECLDQAGFREDEIAFVNARRHDDIEATWAVFPKVIALGLVAEQECRRRYLDHSRVPHPQYWKRFQGHDRQGYVNMLRGLRT